MTTCDVGKVLLSPGSQGPGPLVHTPPCTLRTHPLHACSHPGAGCPACSGRRCPVWPCISAGARSHFLGVRRVGTVCWEAGASEHAGGPRPSFLPQASHCLAAQWLLVLSDPWTPCFSRPHGPGRLPANLQQDPPGLQLPGLPPRPRGLYMLHPTPRGPGTPGRRRRLQGCLCSSQDPWAEQAPLWFGVCSVVRARGLPCPWVPGRRAHSGCTACTACRPRSWAPRCRSRTHKGCTLCHCGHCSDSPSHSLWQDAGGTQHGLATTLHTWPRAGPLAPGHPPCYPESTASTPVPYKPHLCPHVHPHGPVPLCPAPSPMSLQPLLPSSGPATHLPGTRYSTCCLQGRCSHHS